jgi:hypothetical protein
MVQEFCLCSAILESLLFGIGVIGTDSVMLHNAVVLFNTQNGYTHKNQNRNFSTICVITQDYLII